MSLRRQVAEEFAKTAYMVPAGALRKGAQKVVKAVKGKASPKKPKRPLAEREEWWRRSGMSLG